MKTILAVLICTFAVSYAHAGQSRLCKAIAKDKYSKIERLVKKNPSLATSTCKHQDKDVSALTYALLNLDTKSAGILRKYGAKIEDAFKEVSYTDLVARISNNRNCAYVYRCTFIDNLLKDEAVLKLLTTEDVWTLIKGTKYPTSAFKRLEAFAKLSTFGTDFSNLVDEAGNNPFFFARNNDEISFFIEQNVDLAKRNNKGETVFIHALNAGRHEDYLLKLAQTEVFDLNERGSHEEYPIFTSISKNMNKLFDFIFGVTKPNANLRNKFGQTFLHINHGDLNKISFFLNYGTNINIADSSGQTALFLAVKNKKKDAAFYLLENGACKNIIDIQGRAPVSYAIENNDVELTRLINMFPSGC